MKKKRSAKTLLSQVSVLADLCLAQGTEIRTLRDLMAPMADLIPFILERLPEAGEDPRADTVRTSLETWRKIAKKTLETKTAAELMREKGGMAGISRQVLTRRLQRQLGLSEEAAKAKGLLLFPKEPDRG